jgi:hypothetical protein
MLFMKKYDPRYKLQPWDIEHIAYGIARYCLIIRDVRELLGGISRETAYAHVRRWIDLGYAYREAGYILFTQKAFWACNPEFAWRKLGRQNLAHYADVNAVEMYLGKREDMIVLSVLQDLPETALDVVARHGLKRR